MEREGGQNGEGQKYGRQRVMDMASRTEDEMEMDVIYESDGPPKLRGWKDGRQQENAVGVPWRPG